MKIKKLFINFLIVVCSLVFCFSFYKVISIYIDIKQEEAIFTEINEDKIEIDYSVEQITHNEEGILLEYEAVLAKNKDMVGWIDVYGTNINYPVMHTPNDVEYYLYRNFYHEDSPVGTPFIGYNCTIDSTFTIIHAHRSNNGSMFGNILKFENKEYWEEHKYFSFDSLKEKREYEIIAVFEGKALRVNEQGFRYYKYVGELDEKQFNEFFDQVKKYQYYDTGLEAEYGDEIVMLSTCTNVHNHRAVIVGKRIK